jgi:nicotinate phosphoribosyltransferase
MGIINSLLQTDLYKFTQGQVALHQFPWVNVEYKFKCRSDIKWKHSHLVRLREEIKEFCTLKFTEDDLKYLRSIRFFKDSYIDFLKLYIPDINHITIELNRGELDIRVKGPWFLTIYFEVPILSMMNEIYWAEDDSIQPDFVKATETLLDKINISNTYGVPFVDFGTRRRYSRDWHHSVVETLVKNANEFMGTSNVWLAKKFGITPIGTMAHEFLQVGQALDVPLVESQNRMLQAWVNEYRGDLGIALTDVIGIDAFLKDFDLYFAKLYDGLRHDSGCPYEWADKVIGHYDRLGVDSKSKTLVFSDGLNMEKAKDIYHAYNDVANVSFGIGTNLTNDIPGVEPLQVVMKIIKCNDRPVAKISDSPGKGMCEDPEFVSYLKKVFSV